MIKPSELKNGVTVRVQDFRDTTTTAKIIGKSSKNGMRTVNLSNGTWCYYTDILEVVTNPTNV